MGGDSLNDDPGRDRGQTGKTEWNRINTDKKPLPMRGWVQPCGSRDNPVNL